MKNLNIILLGLAEGTTDCTQVGKV